jgi:murein DD-endopeptidase MepM/ murein hydrolase activator NlpD
MTNPTSTRRQLLGSALGLAGLAGVAHLASRVGGDAASAAGAGVNGAAEAASGAVRLSATTTTSVVPRPPTNGSIMFPIDPGAKDIYVLDNFGDCRGSRAHRGVDIMAEEGRDVYAVRAGTLTGSFDNEGTAGWGWTLLGDDGVRYRYMHLDALEPGLSVGSTVAKGAVLGGVGSTGNDTASNVHLHFEVIVDGRWVDPFPLLDYPAGIRWSSTSKACLGGVN